MTAFRLVHQSYGIAMAQCVFGGPRGVWLECTKCEISMRCVGSGVIDEPDSIVSAVYRSHGWTGRGERMLGARCPACSAKAVQPIPERPTLSPSPARLAEIASDDMEGDA